MTRSNATRDGNRGRTNRRRSSGAGPVADALRYARRLRQKGLTWIEVSNALFGPGGKLTELCPTEAERAALAKTSDFQEILRLIEQARDDDGDPVGAVGNWMSTASGTTTLRIPKSLHAALLAEAEAEGTSLNQLCLAKLAVQLRAAVVV
ncbi:MAG TPA: toxin-antitoxin system HicB family antitoxin [Pirellulales bacterium]|nr:toxin-antitoxin system HicB family antitoxin [Pirellulales bacterium]